MPIVNNSAGQTLDDVYIMLTTPPASISGVNSSAVGVVGSASRGIAGALYTVNNYGDFVQKLGQSAASLTGPIAVQNLVRQSAGDIIFTPIFGQGAAPASITLMDVSNNPVLVLTAGDIHPQFGNMQPSYGTWGNAITVSVTAGTATGTFNLTLTSPNGMIKLFNGLTPAQAVSTINAAAAIAIASLPTIATPSAAGTDTTATTGGTLPNEKLYVKQTWTNANGETTPGPELVVDLSASATQTNEFTYTPPAAPTGATGYKLYVGASSGNETLAATSTSATGTETISALPVVGSPVPPTTNTATIVPSTVPVSGTNTFANGSNGATPVDGDYIGTTLPNGQKTGLAALATGPKLSYVMAAEQYSPAINSALATFANTYNCIAVLALSYGTQPGGATSGVSSIAQDNVIWAYPWQNVYDQDTQTYRICSPVSFVEGVGSVLGPEQSLGNKSISGSLGTDVALSPVDIANLQQANIMVVGVEIPAGGVGIRNGLVSTGKRIYVTRMRYFIGLGINKSMGWAVDQLQSTDLKDPLRRQIKNTVDGWLQTLMGDPTTGIGRMIDNYSSVCDLTNNNPQTISNHVLNCDISVNLLSAAEKLTFRANIAEGVLTVSHQ